MGGFTSPLEGDPRVRSIRIDTIRDESGTERKRGLGGLKTSLEQHGLLVPPAVMVINKQVTLLEGSRRVAAAASLGWHVIDAFWLSSPAELTEWYEADTLAQGALDSARPAPMTWTQIGALYDYLARVLPKGNFVDGFCVNHRINRGDAQGAAFLLRTMRDHGDERVREYARVMMAESEAGARKPHSAVRFVREYALAPGGPSAKVDAAEQAKIITNLQGQVAGLISALELLVPIHPSLSVEARKVGGQSLADLGRVVSRVGRVLREKGEAE